MQVTICSGSYQFDMQGEINRDQRIRFLDFFLGVILSKSETSLKVRINWLTNKGSSIAVGPGWLMMVLFMVPNVTWNAKPILSFSRFVNLRFISLLNLLIMSVVTSWPSARMGFQKSGSWTLYMRQVCQKPRFFKIYLTRSSSNLSINSPPV